VGLGAVVEMAVVEMAVEGMEAEVARVTRFKSSESNHHA